MYPDSCGLPNKFHTSSTEQKSPSNLYTPYSTTQQFGRLGSTVCQPLQPRCHQQKIAIGGLGAMSTQGDRLSNAPLGKESPMHSQSDQLHPKRESESMAGETRNRCGPHDWC